MTDQTEFPTEIMAEAERLWAEAYETVHGRPHYPLPDRPFKTGTLALCRLLVATGFKPDVDPIEAKAREIVAEYAITNGCGEHVATILAGESWVKDVSFAKAGILAGMEMGKP